MNIAWWMWVLAILLGIPLVLPFLYLVWVFIALPLCLIIGFWWSIIDLIRGEGLSLERFGDAFDILILFDRI